MEGGLPMLNCLLQQTLRSLCSSPWVYAVFWRILPRNYPPPKWDSEGVIDRSKENKRNWILVWDDGFCDFYECERAGSGRLNGKFGADIFFKMSHEVYNYGEGLMGKIAADNSHKWVFKENPNENESSCFSSWNGALDPHPRQWESHFNSGIQTIAIVSVREGVIQLGSLDKVVEDLNLVISIQRKFNYLQSIPGVFAMQRPYITPNENRNTLRHNNQLRDIGSFDFVDNKQQTRTTQLLLGKRSYTEQLQQSASKWMKLGCDTPPLRSSSACWSIPPLFPPISYSLGALLSNLPCVIPQHSHDDSLTHAANNNSQLEAKIISNSLRTDPTCLGPDIAVHKLSPSPLHMADCKQDIKKAEIPIFGSGYSMEEPMMQLNFQSQGDMKMEKETSNDGLYIKHI